jgi:hypothetical protein
MALSDYRLCDVCGGKAFYDAVMEYEGKTPYRTAGYAQYDDNEMNEKHGLCLGYLGDWAVICLSCSVKYRTAIVPKDIWERMKIYGNA